MSEGTVHEALGKLRQDFELGEHSCVVMVRRRADKTVSGRAYDLKQVFEPAEINDLVDHLRLEDLDQVAIYAITPDRDLGTKALEILAMNAMPYGVVDAVWTDGKVHGHWGGRGHVHANDA